MQRLLTLALLVLSFCVAGLALDRNAFTFTSYDLRVKVDPAKQGFAVEGNLTARNDSSVPDKNLVLQVSSTLQWSGVRVGDQEVAWVQQPYTSDIDHTGQLSEAILTLPKPVAPGASVTVTFAYSGTIPLNTGRLLRVNTPGNYAVRADWDQISDKFTAVRGVGYVAWYPVAMDAVSLSDGPAEADTVARWNARQRGSEMRATFTVPAGQRVVSNADAETVTGETTELQFKSVGSHTPSFAIGAYQTLDRPNATIHYLAEHTQFARDFATSVERTLPQLVDYFGPQKRKLIVIDLANTDVAPFDDGGPVLFVPVGKIDPIPLDLQLGHQLVHTIVSSPRPWINEGLAYLGQLIILEQRAGRDVAMQYLAQIRRPLAEVEATLKPDSKGQPLATTNDQIYIRTKAPFVWFMLRDMLGDSTLSAAIQKYQEAQDTQPAYIQNLIEAQSTPHRDLEQFFDDWVYRDRGLPDFSIANVYPRATLSDVYIVTVTVENTGNVGAEVPVLAESSSGTRSERVSVPAHGKGVVRISFPGKPQRVWVNDSSVPESKIDNNEYTIKKFPTESTVPQ